MLFRVIMIVIALIVAIIAIVVIECSEPAADFVVLSR